MSAAHQTQLTSHYAQKKRTGQGKLVGKPISNARITSGNVEPLVSAEATAVLSERREADLSLLKSFDLNYDFGPCIGISRLERWERAENFGLNPPKEVHRILLQHPSDTEYQDCLWQ